MQSGSRLTDAQWTMALRLFATRAGMSAADLSRVMQINCKTAQKLNCAFRLLTDSLKPQTLPGVSEWDGSLFSRRWVLGGVSREMRRCLLQCIPNRTEETLVPLAETHSDPGSLVFTDEWGGYISLLRHMTVCHGREFTNSQAPFVHASTQEGIWGHAKTLSWHTYRGFKRSSLPQFLAGTMFRYNFPGYGIRVSALSALLTRKTNSHLV